MKRQRKRPKAVEALGKMRSCRQFSDGNLSDMHDLAIIALLQCQNEMRRRGMPSGFLLQRAPGSLAGEAAR